MTIQRQYRCEERQLAQRKSRPPFDRKPALARHRSSYVFAEGVALFARFMMRDLRRAAAFLWIISHSAGLSLPPAPFGKASLHAAGPPLSHTLFPLFSKN